NTDAAVDACPAGGEQDIIQLFAGTFPTTELVLDTEVTFLGAGPQATIIDGGGNNRVFSVNNPNNAVIFEGLTITGGTGSGAALTVGAAAFASLHRCEVRGNDSTANGAIHASFGAVQLTMSTVAENTGAGGLRNDG